MGVLWVIGRMAKKPVAAEEFEQDELLTARGE
jgi:hypothetical protein